MTRRLTNAPRRVAAWMLDREVGERTEGVLWGVVGLCVAVVVVAVWFAATAGINPSASSSGVMEFVLWIVTSTWIVPVLILIAFRSVFLARSDRLAARAAAVTGMSKRSVKRLAAEMQSALGSKRILVAREHSVAEIEDEIERKLDGADGDRLAPRVDADQDDQDDSDSGGDGDGDLPAPVTNSNGDRDRDPVADPTTQPDETGDESRGWSVRSAVRRTLNSLTRSVRGVARHPRRSVRRAPRRARDTARSAVDRVTARIQAWRNASRGREPRGEGGANRAAEPGRTAGHDSDTNDPDGTEDHVSIRDAWALWKRDTAAALNKIDLVTKFAAPTVVVTLGVLLPFGFWVEPPFMLAAVALGVLVGTVNVLRVRRKRRGRVQALRGDVGAPGSEVVSLLVKEVDADGVTAYMAWVGARSYASYDRDEFVEQVARRAVEACDGGRVTPSILEKNADQLRGYSPHLGTRRSDGTADGFLDLEQARVTNELIKQAATRTPAITPVSKLVEDVVEHDRGETRFFGLISAEGKGYDPRLVRRALGECVPSELVVERVTVDVDGEDVEVPVVRPRWVSMPKRTSEVVARFHSLYRNVAVRECAYGDPLQYVEQPGAVSLPRPAVTADEVDDDVAEQYGAPVTNADGNSGSGEVTG